MTPLPVVSSEEAIRAFERNGWRYARHESSHTTLTKPGMQVVLTVPKQKPMKRGLLRKLIRIAGLSVQEFVDSLK